MLPHRPARARLKGSGPGVRVARCRVRDLAAAGVLPGDPLAPAVAGLAAAGGALWRIGAADGAVTGWTFGAGGAVPADPADGARGLVVAHAAAPGGAAIVLGPGTVAALADMAGDIGAGIGIGGGSGFVAARAVLLPVLQGGAAVLVAACAAGGGIAAYGPGGDRLAPPAGAGAPVAALATLRLGGQDHVFAATGGAEPGVTAYRLRADGALERGGSLGAADGLGIAAPTALVPVTAGGVAHLVLAASGTASLTVLRVGADGALTATDHRIDTAHTHFAGAAALAAVTVEGRALVLAAGTDGGISLMELLPEGRLVLHASLVQGWGTGPARIVHLAATVADGTLHVAAAVEGEADLRLFALPLGTLGGSFRAATGGGAATGGAADDLILGSAGDDRLAGGAGSDTILDGAGADAMEGGAGADLFVLAADGAADRIDGFERGADRLDLAAWAMLHGAAQLDIRPTATGAEIRYRDERLVIAAADGRPLTAADFADAGVVPLPRPAGLDPAPPPPASAVLRGTGGDDRLSGGAEADRIAGRGGADTLAGGPGNDRLSGGPGDDWLAGGAGADRLAGGRGADWADYGAAAAGVTARLGDPAANRGEARGDTYARIENLSGSAHDDRLLGDRRANGIAGGAGDDTLLAGRGADTITGGAGADVMTGGAGADTFVFAPGDFRDVIADFTPGLDRLLLPAGTVWTAGSSAGQALVYLGPRDYVLLAGVAPGDLGPGDIGYF